MRKVVFWVIGIIAVMVILVKSSDIVELLNTIQNGALIPIILAVFLQAGRYVAQSAGMVSSFNAVGEKASIKRTITLVISGIFINTIAPTGGMASAVLLVDDGVKRGIKPGKSTSAAMLGMMGNYSGFIIIMIIGFFVLGASGHLDPAAFICGMLMVLIVAFFGGILFVCRKSPRMLVTIFKKVESFVEKACAKIHRKAPKPWAEKIVTQFTEASSEIAERPSGLLTILGWCTLASSLEMLCFICVGTAFGVTAINVLVAAYVVTYIFTVISPSPNGVGVAEVIAAVTLTSYGTPVATATAVALVFRGFVFWIPFAVGALLLRRTGFFDEKKDATDEDKAKANAWLSGIFVFVFGVLNVFFALLPYVPEQYQLLSDWFSIGGVFSPSIAVILGIALMLMTRGIMKRSRVTWAWTMALLIYLAAAQLIGAGNGGKYFVVIAILALAVWLFIKRRDFDQVQLYSSRRHAYQPIVIALVIVFVYTLTGYIMLGSGYFGFTNQPLDAIVATAKTFIPGFENPTPTAAYGQWFYGSIGEVFIFCILWAIASIIAMRLRSRYYVKLGRAVVKDGAVHLVEPGDDAVGKEDVAATKVKVAATSAADEPAIMSEEPAPAATDPATTQTMHEVATGPATSGDAEDR